MSPADAPANRLALWSAAFLLFLLLLWALERWVGEKHWLMMLITYLPQQWFAIPLLALLLRACLGRDAEALLLLSASALVLIVALLGFRLNHPRQARPDVRVMTFNIEAEDKGTGEVLRAIRQQAPDVLCLQEATRNIWASDSPPSPELLRELKQSYHLRRFGHLLIASRWPLGSVRTQALPHAPAQRPILAARAATPSGPVTIVTVHLMPVSLRPDYSRRSYFSRSDMLEASRIRRAQIDAIRRFCRGLPGPLILCGDFNLVSRGPLFHSLASDLRDGFGLAGWGCGHTCPERLPLRRIDHVFARGLKPVGAHVPVTPASDHRPMVVDLSRPESAAGAERDARR